MPQDGVPFLCTSRLLVEPSVILLLYYMQFLQCYLFVLVLVSVLWARGLQISSTKDVRRQIPFLAELRVITACAEAG